MERIVLPEDEILNVNKLRRREHRVTTGCTIVEGYPEVRRAVDAKVPLQRLYICPELVALKPGEFDRQSAVIISKDEFARIAFGSRLKGILGIFQPYPLSFQDLKLKTAPLIIILESVEKPGNLGAVIRTADGAGMDAVIMCEGLTDVYNHNVVRSSLGTVFYIPTLSASNQEAYDFLSAHQITIFAATAHTQTQYTDVSFKGPSAIVMGNEHNGLSEFWHRHAHQRIALPMQGVGNCLNVANSASILMYEALRQRQCG